MRKQTKIYNHNGLAGCVSQRRSQKFKVLVGIYHAVQAGLEDDPTCIWMTVCEDHGTLVGHQTLTLAKSHAGFPDMWCEDCRNAKEGKSL